MAQARVLRWRSWLPPGCVSEDLDRSSCGDGLLQLAERAGSKWARDGSALRGTAPQTALPGRSLKTAHHSQRVILRHQPRDVDPNPSGVRSASHRVSAITARLGPAALREGTLTHHETSAPLPTPAPAPILANFGVLVPTLRTTTPTFGHGNPCDLSPCFAGVNVGVLVPALGTRTPRFVGQRVVQRRKGNHADLTLAATFRLARRRRRRTDNYGA